MSSLLRDLRQGLRSLAKSPWFALQALLTLALGIAANTVIFTMVNSVLLRGLQFRDPDRLVWIWSTRTDRDKAFFCMPDFIEFRLQTRTLEQMAAFANWGANLTGAGDPERLQGVRMTANAFQMLGTQAIVGRTLLSEDGKPSSERAVVLGNALWQRRFGADPGIVGKSLTLNGDSYTVVGVLPREFIFPGADAELAIPLVLETDPRRNDRAAHFLRVFARRRPDATNQQVAAEMAAITERLRDLYPLTNAKNTPPRVLALRDEIAGGYRTILVTLFGCVVLVLLIACSNLANLLLSRNSSRSTELAVRAALGAGRGRIVRQLMTESLLLAFTGGALGLALTIWAMRVAAYWTPADLPRAAEVAVDGRVLAFTMAASLAAGIIFGLTPALRASRIDLNATLKHSGRGSAGGRDRIRNLAVISEMVLSLMLLIATGLFLKSFVKLQAVNPGVVARNLLLMRISLPPAKYVNADQIAVFYDKVAARLAALPGVESVGAASIVPLSNMNARTDFVIAGRPPLKLAEVPAAQFRSAAAGYFRTMRIPIRGREFTAADNLRGRPVAIIDQTLARMYFAGQDAIGQHISFDPANPASSMAEIVGVAGNVKHFGLAEAPLATLYRPFAQLPPSDVAFLTSGLSLAIRASADPLALGSAVQRELRGIDKDIPAGSVRSMNQFVAVSVAPRRFNLLLIAVFGIVALVLAATGLYAVVSYSVAQQSREMGIRIALGANRGEILKMVVARAVRLALIGIVIGMAGSVFLARTIASQLFGVQPADPLIFSAVPLLLVFVAVLASYVPAARASRMDPIAALRS